MSTATELRVVDVKVGKLELIDSVASVRLLEAVDVATRQKINDATHLVETSPSTAYIRFEDEHKEEVTIRFVN